jgi:CspA family cold shock protein
LCMKTGIISWFSDDKGFGFIKPDDKSKDIFFHVSELKKINLETIAGNTKISFETKEDKNNRIQAVNLQLI